MDMRGYNDSEKPAGIDSYKIQLLADDIKGLVKALGVEKFTLVAHDWGAGVAWTFAALYPEMLDNLIILNMPHLMALVDARGKTWEQALKSWYIIFFQCPILPELSMLAEDMRIFKKMFKKVNQDEETIEAYKYAFRDYTAWNRPLNYYRMTTTKEFKTFLEANRSKYHIAVRTLQIFGTADTALSVGAAQEGNKYLSNGRLELLDGVSHWVQVKEAYKPLYSSDWPDPNSQWITVH